MRGTSVFTDEVSRPVTGFVIPEVVTSNGEEGVVVLPQGETHLIVAVVVWLVVGPVKPADRLVHVVPGPGARLVLAVPALSTAAKPELCSLTRGDRLQQAGLQPVVDTRVVELGNPGARVSGTDEVGCRPCHRLVGPDKEASTACPVLLKHPAIRALVRVLGCNQAKGKQKQKL